MNRKKIFLAAQSVLCALVAGFLAAAALRLYFSGAAGDLSDPVFTREKAGTALLPVLFVAPTVDLMDQAKAGLERLYTARNNALFALDHAPERELNDDERAFIERGKGFMDQFDDAMCDDLNTSEAMGVLFEYVRDMNTALSDARQPGKAAIEESLRMLNTMASDVLGLLMKEADTVPEDVKALVQARADAKKAKDFAEADRLRDEVLKLGYVIEDTPKGPKVKKA